MPNSEIWRVRTERMGSLEPFHSERDMESFLMNNPAVVGCWDPDECLRVPSLIREQITICDGDKTGRIDMVGVAMDNGKFELRIFELKPDEIGLLAVEQIQSYMEMIKPGTDVKKKLESLIKSFNIPELDNNEINSILNNPVPVLIGPKFHPEAIAKSLEFGIRCVRLTRFRSEDKSEYYVIVEDQVGRVVSTRRGWSWGKMIEKRLIEASDVFSLAYGENRVTARPAPEYLNYNWTYFLFDEESCKKLLAHREKIFEGSKENSDVHKWINKDLQILKGRKPLVISHASAFFNYAFGGPTPFWYWNPTWMWKHEKSGKSLEDLKNELFNMD